MKFYVQFLEEQSIMWDTKNNKFIPCKPFLKEPCGSDSVFILDGRNKISTMVCDGYKRMDQLKNIHKYKGFKIMKGDLKDSIQISHILV